MGSSVMGVTSQHSTYEWRNMGRIVQPEGTKGSLKWIQHVNLSLAKAQRALRKTYFCVWMAFPFSGWRLFGIPGSGLPGSFEDQTRKEEAEGFLTMSGSSMWKGTSYNAPVKRRIIRCKIKWLWSAKSLWQTYASSSWKNFWILFSESLTIIEPHT